MCRAAGGTPTWTTSIDPTGTVTYIVECDGGYLDGLNCFFDEQFTSCTMTRFGRSWSDLTIEPADIAPLDEPTATPRIEVVEDVDAIAPIEQGPSVTPTPEPIVDGGEPVVDGPVVDDGDVAPEPTATPGDDLDQGPVIDDPVVSDEGDVAPEPTRDPIDIEPQIDVDDIAPIEVITLT
jgi:hypothetical protein